jgi:hypothetical protein
MTNIKIVFYFREQEPLSLKVSNFSPVSAIGPIRYRKKYFTIIYLLQHKIQKFLHKNLLHAMKYVYKEKIKWHPSTHHEGAFGGSVTAFIILNLGNRARLVLTSRPGRFILYKA